MKFAKIAAALLAASTLSLLPVAAAQAGLMDDPFGYFNVYSLHSINYQGSDFEGKAGARNNVNLSSFSLALLDQGGYALHAGGNVTLGSGSYHGTIESGGTISLANATITGSVLAGGNIVNTAGGTIDGDAHAAGTVTLTPHYTVHGDTIGGVAYVPSADHQYLADYFIGFSDAVAGMAMTGNITNSYGALSVSANSGTNIFNINALDLKNAYSFTINGPETAVVYVNVFGNDPAVALDSTNWYYQGGITTGDVLLNYTRQITSLSLTSANNVNILAPFAATSFSSGLVTGSLIVGDLSGKGQVNLGHFDHGPSPDPVPEPATLFMFGTGLVGLIGAKTRKMHIG